MGSREEPKDVAEVVSRMGDIIMARTFKHSTCEELAAHSRVPVINALSDLEHPCQILADLLTMQEVKGKLEGLNVVFLGDGNNNVTHTLCLAAGMLGMHFKVGAPEGYFMDSNIVSRAKKMATESGGSITESSDPNEVVKDADVVITDTWISMGDEAEKEQRLTIFPPYQVSEDIMKLAKNDAIFMHCLPAYRDKEVAAAVLDGPQSVAYQEAENRLHAQKGLIAWLMNLDTQI
ncbi:MAG: Ornithine carbamoyltransferase [Microgenomates bacterium OLB23]|nr:MAG: Ornithine carbamoyltransferase [Microgenomates bacterium OLB23]